MLVVGEKLDNGHYTVVKELGQGGMGLVFHCHDELLQRDVAIKLLLPELMTNQGTVETFHQEARLAAQLEHPNIVTIFEIGKEEKKGKPRHFIAMEYLPGGTLAGRIAQKSLSLEHSLNWMKQLANGLNFAHKKGVVHQDIKSDNVFITMEGDLKLGDFGLAKIAASRVKGRSTHGMGTPAYMSPELCRGEPQDHRSDIYSLGVLFFEMATGELPFKARGMIEMAMKHASAPVPSARRLNPNVPDVLDKTIQRMMAKVADDRYQNMSEVLTILDELIFELRVARLGLGPRLKGATTAINGSDSASFFKPGPTTAPSAPANQFFPSPAEAPPAARHSRPLEPGFAETSLAGAEVRAARETFATGPGTTSEPVHIPMEKPATEPMEPGPSKEKIKKDFEILWSYSTRGPIGWLSMPVIDKLEKTVYVASADGRLYAISASRGHKLWTFDTDGPLLSSPVLMLDKIILAGADGIIYALSPEEGKLLWKHRCSTAVVSTPTVFQETAVATTTGGVVEAIDLQNGATKWTFGAEDAIVSSAQAQENLTFFACRDGNVYAVATRSGSLKWKFNAGSRFVAGPAVSVDAVYIGSQDGCFYSLNAESGRLNWLYSADKAILYKGVIVFTSVVFASQDRWLYSCEKYDGHLLWKAPLRGRVMSNVMALGESVCISMREGLVQAHSAKTGEMQWQLKLQKRLESTPLVSSKALYVGTIEGEIYAYSLPSSR